MKVCMLVFNAVSHDARVLKEADTVRKMGHDVIIVGIQSPQSNMPTVEVLRSGVAITRVHFGEPSQRAQVIKNLVASMLTLMFAFLLMSVLVVGFIDPLSLFGQLSLLPFSQQLTLAALVLFTWKVAFKLLKAFRKRYREKSLEHKEIAAMIDRDKKIYNSLLKPYLKEKKPSSSIISQLKKGIFKIFEAPSLRLPRPFLLGVESLLLSKGISYWLSIFIRERRVASLVKDISPDVIHAHDLNTLPVAVKLKKKLKAHLIFDAHELYGHLAQAEETQSRLNNRILKKFAPYVDKFITVNHSIGGFYNKVFKKLPAARVIMNAVIKSEPFPYDGRLHEAVDISPDTKIALYQGGFAAHRGLIHLVMSAEFLNDDWCLVFMGSGYIEREILQQISLLRERIPDIDNRIKVIPQVPQSELVKWTAGATVGLIPYENTCLNHRYCTPNKLWEYPNAGVPVLVSRLYEMEMMVARHEIGWFLPTKLSARGIADCINQLDEGELTLKQKNCKSFIQSNNWSYYEPELKLLYRELACFVDNSIERLMLKSH